MRGAVLAGLLAFLALVAFGAAAQSSASPIDSGRQFEAGRSAELQNWEWRAQRGLKPSDGQKAVQLVLDAINQRDCPGAVAALNAGLAKAHPEIFTLAGALYEEGVCVKPNWERAVRLYERAVAAGHPGVAARLAAGYAGPAGGRDKATALWWALRAKTALPADCRQVAALVDDADRFVAALNAWPAGRLEHCAYSAAVMASLQAEAEAPDNAAGYGLVGKLRISFVPAAARIDLVEDFADVAVTVKAGDGVALELERRNARKAFMARMREVADRALKLFDKPAGLPAAWRVETEHDYKFTP